MNINKTSKQIWIQKPVLAQQVQEQKQKISLNPTNNSEFIYPARTIKTKTKKHLYQNICHFLPLKLNMSVFVLSTQVTLSACIDLWTFSWL